MQTRNREWEPAKEPVALDANVNDAQEMHCHVTWPATIFFDVGQAMKGIEAAS